MRQFPNLLSQRRDDDDIRKGIHNDDATCLDTVYW